MLYSKPAVFHKAVENINGMILSWNEVGKMENNSHCVEVLETLVKRKKKQGENEKMRTG